MKTLRLIGMALIAVVMCVNFAACSDDDEDESGNAASLIGTWKIVKTVYDDGEITEHDYPYWVIDSSTIYYTDEVGEEKSDYCKYTYDAEKKVIRLTYIDDGRDGGTLTVLKLTSDELVCHDDDEGRTEHCKRVK
ncbi:lipocalin family protein [uncultured Bacteroides sp.]|uniref:lipocalin family protein n=1 Tax=uncultured Bacteroides sp. TaxID=162156 RepID=UPI0025F38D6E|nr:lipocalin family protein [uncultured Bacteroides sp.]